MSDNNRLQSYFPAGSTILANPVGTAPGFIAVRPDGKFIVAMPGVPHEMQRMLHDAVVPWLRERFVVEGTIVTRRLHTIGLPEGDVDHRIVDLFGSLENPKIAVLAHNGAVEVKLTAKAANEQEAHLLLDPVDIELQQRLSPYIFATNGETLEEVVVERLLARHATLSIAESCTGGALAQRIVRVPGASNVFRGAIVAYANDVKSSMLGVDEKDIAQCGAVSEKVVRTMAIAACGRFQTDYAIATTGIAGPTGGSAEKPVGLVWFAVARGETVTSEQANFKGDRATIQARATTFGLKLLWQELVRSGTPVRV